MEKAKNAFCFIDSILCVISQTGTSSITGRVTLKYPGTQEATVFARAVTRRQVEGCNGILSA